MRKMIPVLLVCGFMIFAPVHAQKDKDKKPKDKFAPPEAFQPSADELAQIKAKTAQLAAKIAELRRSEPEASAKGKRIHELLPDVEIYLRGAENIVRFKEFYEKTSVKMTLDSLDRGIKRAEQLAKGETPWTTLATANVLRAYRSVIDGTAQPYGVTYPLEYGKDTKRVWRVDIVLHGRNGKLTEVAFLNSHNGSRKPGADQDWVQIDIFGRGNNAYRWAGETDVFEAMGAFFRGERKAERSPERGTLVDPKRVVLRGFSMGGAGTWHLGLHFPGQWCVMGPGAGFTTTHDYAWKGKKDLPDYQERCLRIYDAIDYAENARMIPIVAYSGGDDPQKLAADNVEKRLKELKIDTMTHLVKPGVGHKFDVDYFAKANALWAQHALAGRPLHRKESFVTYTTRYSWCDESIFVQYLEKHYERAFVEVDRTGKLVNIVTKNVAALSVPFLSGRVPYGAPKQQATLIMIDGQMVEVTPDVMHFTFLAREGDAWKQLTYAQVQKDQQERLRKQQGSQGPIDDAFTRGFVCVIGSGDTFHPSTQKYVDAKLAAFKHDWAKHWRGELPTTGDYAVTPNDIKDKNLILFGDPSSNLTLAQIIPKLPLKWTKDEIEFAGQKYKTAEHVPVLIFPNPLNPQKYVVLNTGHTIPSEDYTKTNAMLFPRLGDYAVLRLTPTAKNAAAFEVATAGLFNEFWQVEKK